MLKIQHTHIVHELSFRHLRRDAFLGVPVNNPQLYRTQPGFTATPAWGGERALVNVVDTCKPHVKEQDNDVRKIIKGFKM